MYAGRTWAVAAASALVLGGLALNTAAAAAPAAAEGTRAATDFNGDGYRDLAVGVPGGTVSGHAGAGFLAVQWGGPNGLSSSHSTLISQNTAGVPGIAEADDAFGTGVDTADVNGDGYTDLLAGAPHEDNGLEGRGAVSVVWGSSSGFDGGLTVANQPYPYGTLGSSVVAGDFTGDGSVDVVFDSATEEIGGVSMVRGPIAPGGTPQAMENVARSGEQSGTVHLARGDFDGDGHPELATTVHALDNSNVSVLRWKDGQQERAWGATSYGASLAAGDFDGDGRDDLAVGQCENAEESTLCGPAQLRMGGGVLVAYGGAASFGSRTQTFYQDSGGIPGTAESADTFGSALSAADVNGDGRDDLALGDPTEAIGSAAKAGMTTLLFGGASGLLDENGTARGTGWNQGTTSVPGAVEAGDRFGAAVRLLDTDDDAAPELLIGSPGENSGTGGIWQLPGTANGPVAARSTTLTPPADAPAFGGILAR